MRILTLCEHCNHAIELRDTAWDGVPFWCHTQDQRDADPPHTPEPKPPLIDHIPKGFGPVAYWPQPPASLT